jgi:hypothetical protein
VFKVISEPKDAVTVLKGHLAGTLADVQKGDVEALIFPLKKLAITPIPCGPVYPVEPVEPVLVAEPGIPCGPVYPVAPVDPVLVEVPGDP